MKLNPKIEACNICGQMVNVNDLDEMLEHVTKDAAHKAAIKKKIEEYFDKEGGSVILDSTDIRLMDLEGEE